MTGPDPLHGLDPVRAPARRGRSTAGVVTLAVVGGLGLVFAVAGVATSGFGGLLLGLGLTLLVLGLGGVLVGRPGWALIRRRRQGAAILVAGLAALAVGASLAPSPPVSTTAAPGPPATTGPTTTAPVTTPPVTTTAAPTTDPTDAILAAAPRGTALLALASLEVKGRAPKTGYDRDLFGNGFLDTDRNGCDTRNDVLDRDLSDLVISPGTQGCTALSGTLHDPYTGADIPFTRGAATSSAVQVDHVVALSDAWQKGAQGWDATKREAFANDPLELLAVDGSANAQKGDGDAATWLPPNKDVRCAYVARQVTVKGKYGLWVTDAERAAIAGVLVGCAEEPTTSTLAAEGDRVVRQQAQVTKDRTATSPAAVASRAAPTVPPRPTRPQDVAPPSTTPAPDDASVYYPNCAAVRAAGADPIYEGQPGYRSKLDGDHDGIACETR